MQLGFVGLGAMGQPIVSRLLAQGHSVVVCDVNEAAVRTLVAKGATSAATPMEVASASETVLVSLPTPDSVRAVALGDKGLIHGTRMKRYVDLSTSGAKTMTEVATALHAKGVSSIDAPVSGGVGAAASGTLAIMVAGDRATFSALKDLLTTIGSRLTYVGEEVGHGQSLKLINNLLAATSLAAASEALVLGRRLGLGLDTMLEVINASSGRSFATEKIIPQTVPQRTFDFGFRTELMHKDVRLCLDEAENLQVSMWLGNSVKQVWSHAMTQGGGKKDFSAILHLFEAWNGVQLGKAANDDSGAAR
ncbi:NAD(P)-dependent oxidoreductase [Ramlibacter sp.]|uniref:NAD(P)-dependent oxidoreductase n=1 Tax=Ramlibacter sp. TaxID=1917967 RepID=UPI003D14B9AF